MKKIFTILLFWVSFIFLIIGVSEKNSNLLRTNVLKNLGTEDTVIVDVSAGTDHNLALDQDGNLWSWGRNDFGQLGNGTTIDSNVPEQIFRGHKFKKISAGDALSAAIDIDNHLYVWGSGCNGLGQRNVPTLYSDETFKDVKCGANQIYAISLSDTTKKHNPIYQNLVYNGLTNPRYGLSADKVKNIYLANQPYISSDSNKIHIWKSYDGVTDTLKTKLGYYQGNAYNDEVDILSVDTSDLSFDSRIVAADGISEIYYNKHSINISGSYYEYVEEPSVSVAMFYVLEDGTVGYYDVASLYYYKSGSHYYKGTNTSFHAFNDINVESLSNIVNVSVSKNLSSSGATAYFVDEDGDIFSLGSNCGECNMLGSTSSISLSESLNPILVDSNVSFTKVSAGKNHVLALDSKGKVYSWGANSYGQLGLGDNNNRIVPTIVKTLNESKKFSFVAFENEIYKGSFNQNGGAEYTVIENGNKGNFNIDNSTGSFEYTPNLDAFGFDYGLIEIDYSGSKIQYQVNVYIDRKPVFTGGTSSFNVECGKTFVGTAPSTDRDGDILTYLIVDEPLKGNVSLNNDFGSFSYTASAELAGGDAFTIGVSDGYCTVEYPVSVHIQSVISYTDKTDIKINLLETNSYSGNVQAKDIDGDTLNYSIKKNGVKGNVTIDSLGNYVYKANDGEYGSDSFIIRVDDGYKPLEITYNVSLFSVEDGGTTLVNKISKGTTYTGQVVTNAYGASPIYSIKSQGSKGTVSIDENTGEYTYIPTLGSIGDDQFVVLVDYGFDSYTLTIHIYQNSAPDSTSVVLNKTVKENSKLVGSISCFDEDNDLLIYSVVTQPNKGSISLNSNTGEYTYYPNSDIAGNDSFSASITDGIDTINVSVAIHIESEIEVTENVRKTISQNTSLSGQLDATDSDGDSLVYSLLTEANNGVASVDSETGCYTYIPFTNYYGSDAFVIKVDDGVMPKNVTVNVFINRAPIADSINLNFVTEGVAITGTVSCSDPDGDILTYSLYKQPLQGSATLSYESGSFAYTPNQNAAGNDSFIIEATDGCDNIFITVNIHNETEVVIDTQDTDIIVNQGKSTTGQVLAHDDDGDALTYSIKTYPLQGVMNINANTGAWTYIASENAKGNDIVEVEITDGNVTKTIKYNLIINTPAAFDEPVYSINVTQDNNYNGIVSASDADGDELTYTIVSQGTKGTVTIDSSTGRYGYFPNVGEAGNDGFIIGVSDGNFVSEVEVRVHIESDITIDDDIVRTSVEKGEVSTGKINAKDLDGDTLTYSISQNGSKGNANVSNDGTYSYFAGNEAGEDTFIIMVTDGIHTKYVTVYIHISSVPVFDESFITINVGQGNSISDKVHATDADGDTLTYTIQTQPSYGSVNLNSSTGEFTYNTPSNSTSSNDSFVVIASDGENTVTATVSAVINNAPLANDATLTIDQGSSGNGTITATDPENDVITYSVTTQGTHGTVSINSSTGEYVYTPIDKAYFGTDSFVVSYTDGYSTKSVVILVDITKNRAPSANGGNLTVKSNETVTGKMNGIDPEGDELTYSVSTQGDKGTAVIDEKTGEFKYTAKPNSSGYDCFVITVSDGFNLTSYLVEVNISFVDFNNSWAIPTTAVVGGVALISICGLLFVLFKKKKKTV